MKSAIKLIINNKGQTRVERPPGSYVPEVQITVYYTITLKKTQKTPQKHAYIPENMKLIYTGRH